jgi:RNA recognition motif-containing protein
MVGLTSSRSDTRAEVKASIRRPFKPFHNAIKTSSSTTINHDTFPHTPLTPTMATTTVAKMNAAPDSRVQPNQSLYIQNLPEKLQKPDLKRSLYMLFSTFGPVLDVTAVKSSKMRGQAHVLFRVVHAATQAMRACQGFDFFGREMVRRAIERKRNPCEFEH